MNVNGWKYYNHAAVPTTAPHQEVDLTPVLNGNIWKIGGGIPLLARWQSDWDCKQMTEWWYCIKDTPFDINALKSKRRYEINKGNKYFYIQKIDPSEYSRELYEITVSAFSEWPEKYRPTVHIDDFIENLRKWERSEVFGAFERETDRIRGFALLTDKGSYVEFSVLRVEPKFEKLAINASIVSGILDEYKDRFDGRFYINDGTRAIHHETAFQDYLEKYFGFRKAYCQLNIKYRLGFGLLINAAYPFRKKLSVNSKIGNLLSGILKMEEIRRSF